MAVDLVVSIVTKIGEYLVAPVGRQFGYLIHYERNVENLKEQVQKLKAKRSDIQIEVDAAKSKSDIIKPTVEEWLTRVDELSKDADKFHEDEVIAKKGCLKGWCPNLKARYSLSRRATKKTKGVEELRGEGNFSGVSCPAAAPAVGTTFISTGGFKGFESRRSIMNEVVEALTDNNIYMIGICGMGGVGKTTMVKEVAKKAEEKEMFDKIVMVVVSQNQDLINIQGEIAKIFGVELFGGNNLIARAGDLRSRILRNRRVLVILDDVWKTLELNEIGIPCGEHHKGCKIVITSRSENVCNSMDVQKNFKVGILGEGEAWNLFKEMAEISNEGTSHLTELRSTQMAVAKECGGLPIAIVTVGRALRRKSKISWDSALEQLRKSVVKNITEVDEKVFKLLELSYNYLESEEAQKCFLLCSLYPEEFYILIEDLVRYGIGLGLFERIDSVGEARVRVHSLVNDLQKCYLLLECGGIGEYVQMHDVVRDMAISIASRQSSFMVRCDKVLEDWPEKDRLKNYSKISLKLNGMHGLPSNLEFPNLQLLQLDCNAGLPPISYDLNKGVEDVKVQETPGSFYQGMKELRVLALSDMYGSLPTSLGCLTNLRTLSLFHCRLTDDDVSVIGALENLEILSFAGSYIKELPKELLGHLGHLKVLDLLSCKVERIYPGVLSSLSKLEELYIGCSFQSWCEVEKSKERAKAIIDELASLPNLMALDITLLNINFWPRGLVIEKLKKFNIVVGLNLTYIPDPYYPLSNQFDLKFLNMSDIIERELNKLLKSTGKLSLENVDGFKNLLCDLVMNGDGFECLTDLTLECCDNLEYLIDTTYEVSQSAFPVLESMRLGYLCNFKGIISHDYQLPNEAFSALKRLSLYALPELKNLWKGPTQLVRLSNLTSLYVATCDELESAFSLSIARNLMHLEKIKIIQCGLMEEIVSSEGGEHEITAITDKIELPKLRELCLGSLPNFTAICKAMNAIELPQLRSLELENIPKLKSLFPASDSESNYDTIIQPLFNKKVKLTTIETLIISRMDNLIEMWPNELLQAKIREMTVYLCPKLSNILFSSNSIKGMQNLELLQVEKCRSLQVAFDLEGLVDREGMSNIAFPSLKMVTLTHLPKLTHVWKEMDNSPGIQGFQNLRSLIVKGCGILTNLFSSSLAKLLVKLQEMEVAECDVMEAIFANESKADDDEVTTNTIIFPQLNNLKLSDLPKLKSFCSKAYKFEGSLLKSVEVINCPNIKALPPTYQLKLEQQRSNQKAVQKANFSTSDQHYCLVGEKVFTRRGEFWKLTFTEIDEPTKILKVGRGWLNNLRSMIVRNCGKLLSVISSNLMQDLKILEELEVWYCDSLEVIFHFEEEFGTSIPPPFSNLELKYLPKLTHIWKNFPQQIQYFQNLRNLRVERCDSLRYVFTFSIVKALVNLKYLTIAHCNKVEKIITKEDKGGEDEERGKIKITSINLEELPSLVGIGIPDFQIDINVLNANSCPKFRGDLLFLNKGSTQFL